MSASFAVTRISRAATSSELVLIACWVFVTVAPLPALASSSVPARELFAVLDAKAALKVAALPICPSDTEINHPPYVTCLNFNRPVSYQPEPTPMLDASRNLKPTPSRFVGVDSKTTLIGDALLSRSLKNSMRFF